MHPEQQRLMQIFVAPLAMNPSDFQEIDLDQVGTGEKIYQYNAVHEICNFGAKVIVESVSICFQFPVQWEFPGFSNQ